ncbi:MAG: lytic murein transglycosylase [Proteobacteria bacterium]|nr:lytic murein transglycosylase [Pseudomonadota bacterium]MBU1709135.1 lytic murein transglycosylase [Pseudomonadota bacterium]
MKKHCNSWKWFAALLWFVFFTPDFSSAEPGAAPLAADLVEDGQLIDLATPRYKGVFKELRLRHNFSQEEIDRIFKGVTIRKRVLELMDTQWEAKPYYEYYPRFITRDVIKEGRNNLEKYRLLLDRVEEKFGVEREIVIAIWGIETRYGKYEGAFNLFRTLNTMFDAYPRRRDFYRKQLVEFLLLCRENGVEPQSVTSSYGGAFGQTQFIPSSFRAYAVDFDGDNKRDVWNSIPDILASIANYLKNFDWTYGAPIYGEIGTLLKEQKLEDAYKNGRKGLMALEDVAKAQGLDLPASPDNKAVSIVGLELENGAMRYVVGYPNFQAITKWNNSNRYAMAVTELAANYKK